MLFSSKYILVNSIKNNLLHSLRYLANDACKSCALPSELLKTIDQGDMSNSVAKYRRHLCIGQSFLTSQWPKDIKDLQGDYIKQLMRILHEKKHSIGYSIKVTSGSTLSKNSSEHTADWYLFPDQIKLCNVHVKQIDEIIQTLFVNDQSIIKIKDKTKTIEEQRKTSSSLPLLPDSILCEKLDGIWILVCCHQQRDQRCGIIGPILVDEIENYIRQKQLSEKVHCLKISHVGGHKFAGNVIVYPQGTWYGRVSTCHIPILIDAYTSSSMDSKDKLKPLLRGSIEAT